MTANDPIMKIRSSALTGFTEHCRRHLLNPIHLLAHENLSPAVLRSQELQIPYESFVHILNRAASEANYPLFGLTLSLRNGIEALGTLGLMASQSATLADGLAVVQKYLHYHAQGVSLELKQDNNEARLIFDMQLSDNLDIRQLQELGMGRIISVLRALSPTDMKVISIHFKHLPLTSPEKYSDLLTQVPHFGARQNVICFPAHFLTLPPPPASERVRRYFESFLNRIGQNQSKPLKQQVVRLIHELIPTGEASAAAVARLLGMHTRSMQRQLSDIDTDFRTLLEEVRFKLACEALSNLDTALTDLALQLGYSELSAFSRAFKRWTGRSPQQWQAQNASTITPAPIPDED